MIEKYGNGILIDLRFINLIIGLSLSTIPKSWNWYTKTHNDLILNMYFGINLVTQEGCKLKTLSIFILPVRITISFLAKKPYELYDPRKEKRKHE